MPMKDWIHRLQPVQLYVILALSICYFLVQLFLSHITHALTLLIDSYHMLCNIIALSGCILTIKHSKKYREQQKHDETVKNSKDDITFVEICADNKTIVHQPQNSKLHNTFGWTRIDILTMLIVCIFLASLSFSLLVEALQTLVHIEHQDAMHLPVPVFMLGAMGLVLNGLCYLMIGGYTMHQGSFLRITSSGDVVLENITSGSDLKPGSRRLSKSKRDRLQTDTSEINFQPVKRQGLTEMFRDICSTLFVMICAVIIFFADDQQVSKFVDPIMSIISAVLLLFLSYPYMKESCLILLQTIPASIDIAQFETSLLQRFSEIISVHDLHIWQLTASKYISTAHIIFRDPIIYTRVMDDVINFFYEQGITQVTIQPEFKDAKASAIGDCHFQCTDVACAEKHCCRTSQLIPPAIVISSEEAKLPEKEISKPVTDFKPIDSEKSKSTVDLSTLDRNDSLRKYSSDPDLAKAKAMITSTLRTEKTENENSRCNFVPK